MPPTREQENISSYIEKENARIEQTVSYAEREIKLIQEYRTRLISDVVTGKVDVRSIKVEDITDEELLENMPDTEEIPVYSETLAGREEVEDSLEDGEEI